MAVSSVSVDLEPTALHPDLLFPPRVWHFLGKSVLLRQREVHPEVSTALATCSVLQIFL